LCYKLGNRSCLVSANQHTIALEAKKKRKEKLVRKVSKLKQFSNVSSITLPLDYELKRWIIVLEAVHWRGAQFQAEIAGNKTQKTANTKARPIMVV
jgi:hypothetical protein